MSSLLRDVRYGWRVLRKNPGFATVAVLVLAVGIAATTAIYSVVYATIIAPLPYPQPDQLVMVWSHIRNNRNSIAAGDFVAWKEQASAFQDLNAWTGRDVNLATADRPEKVTGRAITPGFLSMVGYDFVLGRDFRKDEGVTGQDHELILSNELWHERFNADPGIVNRDVRVDGKPYTVVGVLSAGAGDRLQDKIYVPLAFTPDQLNHDFHWLLVMGRLKPGVTIAQAGANMDAVTQHLADLFPTSNTGWGATVEALHNDFLSKDTITALWLLLGAVGFVLLIACANVANLLLARGTSRQRELALRGALGASKPEIVRQFITESVMLALIGGALGVILAALLIKIIMTMMPNYTLPSEADVRLNIPVLLFALGACTISGLLFGAAPAWQSTRANLNDVLKDSGRSVTGSRHRIQRVLVVVEFALALTLLSGGGLAVHSLFRLSHVDLGFQSQHLLTFNLPVPDGKLGKADEINTFYGQLLDRARATPGVVAISTSTGIPVNGTNFGMPFTIVGKPVANQSQRPGAGFNMVSPEYFKTFGISITRGRAFSAEDRSGTQPVAIVDDAFVRRFLKDVDPLTQRIEVEQLIPGVTKLGPPIEWQIVGVYGAVKNGGPRGDFPEIDVPFAQSPWPQTTLAVRTVGDPTSVTASLGAAVRSLDPDLPLADVKTMDQLLDESMAGDRFNTLLFGGFAAVALLLAAFGIYGVMSFVVAQRTHEIGLRMALGANRGHVLRQVVRQGMLSAVLGAVLGTAGAYFVGRAMRGMVVGVGVLDPLAYSAVAVTLLLTALLACLVPAARAASVDPLIALRQE